ncbi:MAG: hypothetical protein PVH17_12745, partial [Anaerolineae bacterium]
MPARKTHWSSLLLMAGVLVLITGWLLVAIGIATGKGAGASAANHPIADRTEISSRALLSVTYSYTTYLPLVMAPPRTPKDLVTQTLLTLPEPLAGTSSSFCVWDWCDISPRLYHEPLVDDRTLIGWTDADDDGHVSVVGSAGIEQTFDFASRSLRGLTAHSDGTFAVLLYDATNRVLWLSRRAADGSEIWTTNLNSDIAEPDFWLGGSRLTYGDGLYLAYFTVQGTSGGFTGHYGDQLTYVDDS